MKHLLFHPKPYKHKIAKVKTLDKRKVPVLGIDIKVEIPLVYQARNWQIIAINYEN